MPVHKRTPTHPSGHSRAHGLTTYRMVGPSEATFPNVILTAGTDSEGVASWETAVLEPGQMIRVEGTIDHPWLQEATASADDAVRDGRVIVRERLGQDPEGPTQEAAPEVAGDEATDDNPSGEPPGTD